MCPRLRHGPPAAARGFSLVTAIFLIVVLMALGAFIVNLMGLASSAANLDVLGARAYQAARAGIEWGAYQTLRGAGCSGTTTLGFPAGSSLDGFVAEVSCTSTPVNELGTAYSVEQISATACNAAACPGAPTPNYVERALTITVMRP